MSLTPQNYIDSYLGTKFLSAVVVLGVEIVFRLPVSELDPLCQYFYILIEIRGSDKSVLYVTLEGWIKPGSSIIPGLLET